MVNNWIASAFQQCFYKCLNDSQGNISVDLAADIATKLSKDMYAPVISKIDPIEVGEICRLLNIANHYGDILKSTNVKEGTITKLVSKYPCHSFVIDRKQATELFEEVNPLDDFQKMIYNYYEKILAIPFPNGGIIDLTEK